MTQALADTTRTTQDWLLAGKVRFDQPATGYRVAIDPVLLAAAVPAVAGERVLELGSGAGAASLCLHHRVADCDIVGLERDAEMLALARRNAAHNHAGARVSFVGGDLAAPPPAAEAGFDHVFCNPPFLGPRRADRRNTGDSRRFGAEIETSASLADWVGAMVRAAKPKGRLTLVHRADRLDELLTELSRAAGEIVVFPLWPKSGRPAKRVLIGARTAVATPLRLAAGLVLHEPSGAYTKAARAVLENGEPLVI